MRGDLDGLYFAFLLQITQTREIEGHFVCQVGERLVPAPEVLWAFGYRQAQRLWAMLAHDRARMCKRPHRSSGLTPVSSASLTRIEAFRLSSIQALECGLELLGKPVVLVLQLVDDFPKLFLLRFQLFDVGLKRVDVHAAELYGCHTSMQLQTVRLLVCFSGIP